MNKAMYSLYQELFREAREEHWIPTSVTSRLAKKTEKAKQGKVDFSDVVIDFIRETEKYIQKNLRGDEQALAKTYIALKRNQFSELQREVIDRGK